jgi:hypothetical protein
VRQAFFSDQGSRNYRVKIPLPTATESDFQACVMALTFGGRAIRDFQPHPDLTLSSAKDTSRRSRAKMEIPTQ